MPSAASKLNDSELEVVEAVGIEPLSVHRVSHEIL